jgi:hypothetical protein
MKGEAIKGYSLWFADFADKRMVVWEKRWQVRPELRLPI